ncbi:MAG: GNAT family N-acetyltransferase [Clostridia bacterium]|nr:GNAT family N-acetyltransferase [Clostridia bacterium]
MLEFKKIEKERNNEALDLVWQVFSIFEVPDFPPEGALEYKRIIDETRTLRNVEFYACLDNDKIVGVLGMRDNNHIGYFYVDPQYHKRGIGKTLFNLMKGDYEKKEFTVNAAPYGVPVYRRLGFVETDTIQNLRGVIFTPMKYKEMQND